MALIFSDPNTSGPFSTFQVKERHTKVFKLTYANFTTGNTDALIGRLPADASIVQVTTWLKTAFAGNSVASPVLSLGSASGGTQFSSAVALTNTVGTYALHSPVTGIMQEYAIPLGGEINLYARGGCSTGNPTSGELMVMVDYVR
jgi:hypothetical protein